MKITLVGSKKTEKTKYLYCLTRQKPYDTAEYIPSCEQYSSIQFTGSDGKDFTIKLCDTSGVEGQYNLIKLHYPRTDLFLLAFDISDKKSILDIQNGYLPGIKESMPNTPFIIVGMHPERRTTSSCSVSSKDGKKMAKKLGAASYIECSLTDISKINEVFNQAINVALDHINEIAAPTSSQSIPNKVKNIFKRNSVPAVSQTQYTINTAVASTSTASVALTSAAPVAPASAAAVASTSAAPIASTSAAQGSICGYIEGNAKTTDVELTDADKNDNRPSLQNKAEDDSVDWEDRLKTHQTQNRQL